MRNAVYAVFVCCLLLCVAHVGLAQNTNSSDIRGTATDQSGAVLPGVTVTVLNNQTGVIRTFVTNADGIYDTNSILPGTYTVTFSKTGFEKLVKNSIVLQVGLATVDGALQVGAITQEVTVSSDLPLLKTEDAQVSTTLSTLPQRLLVCSGNVPADFNRSRGDCQPVAGIPNRSHRAKCSGFANQDQHL
jgi:hypothetical protein